MPFPFLSKSVHKDPSKPWRDDYGAALRAAAVGEIPVNAVIPNIDGFFVEDHDPHASLTGARGIGELGAVGVTPAILNAVHHATGKRVRDLPIRIDRLLDGV